jgi:hypothetical protein
MKRASIARVAIHSNSCSTTLRPVHYYLEFQRSPIPVARKRHQNNGVPETRQIRPTCLQDNPGMHVLRLLQLGDMGPRSFGLNRHAQSRLRRRHHHLGHSRRVLERPVRDRDRQAPSNNITPPRESRHPDEMLRRGQRERLDKGRWWWWIGRSVSRWRRLRRRRGVSMANIAIA